MELMDKVNLMAKVYCKGFHGSTGGIYTDCYSYLNHNDVVDKQKCREHALTLLSHIENHYLNLDFEKLDSNCDFAPIFVVKKLLIPFGEEVRKFLDKPHSELLDQIKKQKTVLIAVGDIYQVIFDQRLSELRKIPDYKNYPVKVVDSLEKTEFYF